jgi:hypothetical protein
MKPNTLSSKTETARYQGHNLAQKGFRNNRHRSSELEDKREK